jgi:hypothetical protein
MIPVLLGTVAWLACGTGPGEVGNGAIDPVAVAKQLQAYYENGDRPPPWAEAIKRLSAGTAEPRAEAAEYLVALLDRALQDERSGKAPWRATPFWGSSGENPARNLREQIAGALAKAPGSPAALPVVRWYLDHEAVPRFQDKVLDALVRIDGKEADEYRLALLQPPHANAAVVFAALQQIGQRKLPIAEGVLKALCHHHRPGLREAARKLNNDRGGADPGPFDPAGAMQRPPLTKLMVDVGALLGEQAPPTAEFVRVTTRVTGGEKPQEKKTVGWLVKDDGDSWVVLTPFGHRETFHKEKVYKYEGGSEYVYKSRWEKYPIAQEVKRVAVLRKDGDKEFQLSERGGLTGQFQGGGAGVYEVVLAHWLYTAKQYDLAAELLLPGLDSYYMDRHLVDMVRQRFGEMAGYAMLVAFAGDRDYGETLRLAEALVQRYPGTRFHEYAVRLAKEVPKRRDDFKQLKLPTPGEWAALKQKLSRAEQVEYLARRLRLLNCFQRGQPGGYSIAATQYAEPCGLSDNAAWGLGRGKTEVINPYVELTGEREEFLPKEEKRPQGLKLTVADIPYLAPFLREDWYLLCVSFWRDFHPDRHLDTTRPVIAAIINSLAWKDICSASEMDRMTDGEREAEIERIIEWARKNAQKDEGTLILEGLEAEWQPGKAYWLWLKTRLSRLAELKEKRALPLLHRRLDDPKTSDEERCWILSYGRRLDAGSFKKEAEQLVQHESLDVQQQAALLLHATGERKQSHEAFTRILEKGHIDYGYDHDTAQVLKALAEEGTPAAHKVMARITTNPRLLTLDSERARLLRILAAAGLPESYRYYVPLLDRNDEQIAWEIVQYFAPKDAEIIRIKMMFPEAADQIAPLKEWLKAKTRDPRPAEPEKQGTGASVAELQGALAKCHVERARTSHRGTGERKVVAAVDKLGVTPGRDW